MRSWKSPVVLFLASLVLPYTLTFGAERTVKASEENVRSSPNGQKIGTLLEGTKIEEVDREGDWVKFKVEAWIWGPSLVEGETKLAKGKNSAFHALHEIRQKLKTFVEERAYGTFYGVRYDQENKLVLVRLRTARSDRETFTKACMELQLRALEAFEGTPVEKVRVETNRPDGTGEVGIEQIEADAETIREYADKDYKAWEVRAKFSTDGGGTWE